MIKRYFTRQHPACVFLRCSNWNSREISCGSTRRGSSCSRRRSGPWPSSCWRMARRSEWKHSDVKQWQLPVFTSLKAQLVLFGRFHGVDRCNSFTTFGFWQKSSAAAEEETLPGSTPGQDWQSDQQSGAAGESVRVSRRISRQHLWWSVTDYFCCSDHLLCVFFRSKTWSLPRSRRRSLMGWKLEMNVWRKCTRWEVISSKKQRCITAAVSVIIHELDVPSPVRWCLLKRWSGLWMKLKMPSNTKGWVKVPLGI